MNKPDQAQISSLIDPSVLTTQALALEINHLKELLQSQIAGIQTSIQIAHDDMVRVPTDVMKQVGTLKDLHEEKFKNAENHRNDMKLAFINAAKEADLRYLQRFEAQEKALEIALATVNRALDLAVTRIDKEFHEHLVQVREETRVAFANSERAILKAEIANEKRFEGINEFRGQLSDQAASFMPRSESMALHHATGEKIDGIMTRLDKQEGKGSGLNQGWGYLVGAIGLISTLVGIATAIIIFSR